VPELQRNSLCPKYTLQAKRTPHWLRSNKHTYNGCNKLITLNCTKRSPF
jgi:hypothetical protein